MSDGTGRIYKRGRVWWIQYGYRGKDYRESSSSRKKSAATALLRKRMREMGKGRLVGPQEERVTFDDLARWIEDDYAVKGRRSLPQLKSTLKRLRAYFTDLRALDITTDRIRAYVRARQEEGYANGTIRKDLAALKRAFNLGIQAGQLSTKPYIPSVRADDARSNFLTMADVEAVAREIGPDLGPLVRFAALTGWRRNEVRSLRWGQVDFEAKTVRLAPGTTKNRDGRTFPFRTYPPLERLLVEQRERTRKVERRRGIIVPWVFHRDGDEIKSFRRAWKGACKRAGLPGAWFHDLRRTAVVNLEAAGVPRSVAMKLTGHKTESVYRRYAIADTAALEEGVAKLARLHETQPCKRKAVPFRQAKA